MSSMMEPKFPKDTQVICTNKDKEFKGIVSDVSRIKGTDYFKYSVILTAEKAEACDPTAPTGWKTISPEVKISVSDYQLQFLK